MDDKELIKKIMEEVKDEKLREELLRRVAKGEGSSVEKILKRIEHRLKAEDSLAKQEIMHGRTEKTAKIEWWEGLIGALFYVLFLVVFSVAFYFIFFKGFAEITNEDFFEGFAETPNEDFEGIFKLIPFLMGIFWLLVIVNGIVYAIIQVYYLLEGKKEYERLKKEEEELEK